MQAKAPGLGSFTFNRRILAWDSYECHMEDSVIKSLNAKKVDTVIVPGRCTKYIQAPDVLWNKPFTEACTEKYDNWMGTVGIHSETAAGNLRAPPRKTVIHWTLQSWADISTDLNKESFPCCGLNLPVDGSDDDKIICFRDGEPCAKGKDILDENPFEMITESDAEDANDPHQVVDTDSEHDDDIDMGCNNGMFL